MCRWLREEEAESVQWSSWPPKVWKEEEGSINFVVQIAKPLGRETFERDESLEQPLFRN